MLLPKEMQNMSSLVAAAPAPGFLQATFGPLNCFFSGLFFFLGGLSASVFCAVWCQSASASPGSLSLRFTSPPKAGAGSGPVPVCVGHVRVFG